MALAVSLLPKVLRPMDGEMESDLISPDEAVNTYANVHCFMSIVDYAKGDVIVYEPDKYQSLSWDQSHSG